MPANTHSDVDHADRVDEVEIPVGLPGPRPDAADDAASAVEVRLYARRGRSRVADFLPLVTARARPLTQEAAITGIADVVVRDGLDDDALRSLLEIVGRLGWPPTAAEQRGLAAVAAAVGRPRLARLLDSPGGARLGAIRLSLLEGRVR